MSTIHYRSIDRVYHLVTCWTLSLQFLADQPSCTLYTLSTLSLTSLGPPRPPPGNGQKTHSRMGVQHLRPLHRSTRSGTCSSQTGLP